MPAQPARARRRNLQQHDPRRDHGRDLRGLRARAEARARPTGLLRHLVQASGQSWSMTSYAPVPGVGPDTPADHDYEGGFAAALMLKDLKLATERRRGRGLHADGRRSGRALPALCRPRWRLKDFSGIIKMIDDSWKPPTNNREDMRIGLLPRSRLVVSVGCEPPQHSGEGQLGAQAMNDPARRACDMIGDCDARLHVTRATGRARRSDRRFALIRRTDRASCLDAAVP